MFDAHDLRDRRDERIALLAEALADGEAPGTPVRVEFQGLDPACGVNQADIFVHDLPAGCLRLDVVVISGPITSGSPDSIAATDKSWPVAAGEQRTAQLRALGWVVDPTALRMWEVDPADPESLGQVVDGITEVIDTSARIAAVPGAAHTTWTFRRSPAQPPTAGTVPRDEPWQEDASELDLRTRIISLASLRGGRIVVRSPLIALAQLELTASRLGDRITVRASDDLSSWRGRWTIEAGDAYVGGILEELRGVLASHEPGAPGPTPLSLRIERHDEAANWDGDSGYVLGFGVVASLVIGAVAAAALGHPAVTMWLDEATRLASDQGGAIVLLAAVGMTTMIPVMLGWSVAEALCSRLRIGYAISAWVDFAAGTVTGVAYIALLATTGDQTALVVAVTWALGIAVMAGPGLLRRLRGGATGPR